MSKIITLQAALEPLSIAVLLFFGVIYLISTWKIKKQQQQQELKT
jgi:hypothetical protein